MAKLKEGDFVFIPGMDMEYVNSIPSKAEKEFFKWLKECLDKKVTVCSFVMGLLLWAILACYKIQNVPPIGEG